MAGKLSDIVSFVKERRMLESAQLTDVRKGIKLRNKKSGTIGTVTDRISPGQRFVSVTFKKKKGRNPGEYTTAQWRTTNVEKV